MLTPHFLLHYFCKHKFYNNSKELVITLSRPDPMQGPSSWAGGLNRTLVGLAATFLVSGVWCLGGGGGLASASTRVFQNVNMLESKGHKHASPQGRPLCFVLFICCVLAGSADETHVFMSGVLACRTMPKFSPSPLLLLLLPPFSSSSSISIYIPSLWSLVQILPVFG